ncbi:MAG: response regulator [Rhodospirillales bacterium]|nr:response regulator [Rhodospirillales bacterium]
MANILLVEDHEDVREALCEILQQAGHAVTEAHDGVQAETFLGKNRYDLMITDIMMPNKTGFDLIDDVKKSHQNMKIIAISGGGNYLTSSMTTKLANLRADKALSKPFMPNQIIQAIDDIMS